MRSSIRPLSPRMLDAFLRRRLQSMLTPGEHDAILAYLGDLLAAGHFPAYRGRWFDTEAFSLGSGVPAERLKTLRADLQPLCDAVCRAAADRRPGRDCRPGGVARVADVPPVGERIRRGRRPSTGGEAEGGGVGEAGTEPVGFAETLRVHMERNADSVSALHCALVREGVAPSLGTLLGWSRGISTPRNASSMITLGAIERRYGLQPGLFARLLGREPSGGSTTGAMDGPLSPSERRRLAWHLPHDFSRRSPMERAEILAWVREVVISGATDYRRFQAAAMKTRYALRFIGLAVRRSKGVFRRATLTP